MSLLFPFNFRPSATVQGNGGAATYTVPAGKYAYITVSLTASISHAGAEGTLAGGTGSVESISVCNTDSKVFNFWLTTGDVVTFTLPADSAVTSAIGPTHTTSTVQASVSINGNIAGICAVTVSGAALNSVVTGFSSITRAAFNASVFDIP